MGDSFNILSAESIVGEFDLLSLAALGDGLNWNVSYIIDALGTDFVTLTVVDAVPLPPAVWLFGSGLLLLWRLGKRSEKTENL